MKIKTFLSTIALCAAIITNIFTDPTVSALSVNKNSKIIENYSYSSSGKIGAAIDFLSFVNDIKGVIGERNSKKLIKNARCEEKEGGTWNYSSTWYTVASIYFHPYSKHAASVICGSDVKYAEAGPGATAWAFLDYTFPRSGKEAYWYKY